MIFSITLFSLTGKNPNCVFSKSNLPQKNEKTPNHCQTNKIDYTHLNKNSVLSFNTDVVLSSKRLVFKTITEDDFDSLCLILKNPRVMYAWEHNFTDEDVQNWIAKRSTMYKNIGYDYFLAINKDTNEVVGQIGLLDEVIDKKHFTGLGYILKEEFWHKGYAIEGGKAMMAYAFDTLKKEKLIATIRPENTASAKVAKNLGMTIESEFVKVYNNKKMPHLVYSISRENWKTFGCTNI